MNPYLSKRIWNLLKSKISSVSELKRDFDEEDQVDPPTDKGYSDFVSSGDSLRSRHLKALELEDTASFEKEGA